MKSNPKNANKANGVNQEEKSNTTDAPELLLQENQQKPLEITPSKEVRPKIDGELMDWKEFCIILSIFAPLPSEYQVSAFLLTFLMIYLSKQSSIRNKLIALLASFVFPTYSSILATVVSELPMTLSEKVAFGILTGKVIQNIVIESPHSSLLSWHPSVPYSFYHVIGEFSLTFGLTQSPGLLGLSGNWISVVVLFIQGHRTSTISMILLAVIMRLAAVLDKELYQVMFALSSLYPVGLVSSTIATELFMEKTKQETPQQADPSLQGDQQQDTDQVKTALGQNTLQSIEMLPCLVGPLVAYKDQTQLWRLFSVVGVISYRFVRF